MKFVGWDKGPRRKRRKMQRRIAICVNTPLFQPRTRMIGAPYSQTGNDIDVWYLVSGLQQTCQCLV